MRRPAFAAMLLVAASLLAGTAADGASSLMEVDYRSLVSRADLHYDEPVTRSEEGMPVGNGRMGSLVWTAPTALRFQINRVDVFAENCETNSFPARDSDYGWGICGGTPQRGSFATTFNNITAGNAAEYEGRNRPVATVDA
ncbi:MAG: hypothetical protein Q8Q12_05535 [bacterium]|nr:hypothetical protein [bacterium]